MSCYLYNILDFLEKKLSVYGEQCSRIYFVETEEIIKYLFTSYILSEKQVVLCRSGHFLWKECVAQMVCLAK
jgi:hypothetical protein